MDVVPLRVLVYVTSAGVRPFEDWLESLDKTTGAIVDARLVRVQRAACSATQRTWTEDSGSSGSTRDPDSGFTSGARDAR